MKKSLKILSFTLATALAAGTTFGLSVTAFADGGGAAGTVPAEQTAPSEQTASVAAAETKGAAQVYLVPGEGNSLEGTKLAEDELSALHMEGDVYRAGATGTQLPTPATTKTDRTGASFVFNGWWTIVDASVTYYTTVPEVEENTYLYADFRAALSQPQGPVNPSNSAGTSTPQHYMLVTRAATGKQEMIPLHVSGTEVSNAVQAGYGKPVQWYNEWFVMEPGDTVSYWFSGVYGTQPMYGPRPRHTPVSCDILLNASGQYGQTGSYMQYVNDDYDANDETHSGRGHQSRYFFNANAADEPPTLSYTGPLATQPYIFRIYIQFYDEGGHMTLYMENLSLKLGVEA